MRTSRILILLAAGALVGFSIFGVMVSRAVDVEEADRPEALRRFSTARAAFAGQAPMLGLDAAGRVVRRADPPEATPRALRRLEVLAYRAGDARLVSAHVPFWFFRLKRPALEYALSGTGLDLDRLQLTAADLERHGPGLVLDETSGNGDRLLVWTE
jgi:hypothetical protein